MSRDNDLERRISKLESMMRDVGNSLVLLMEYVQSVGENLETKREACGHQPTSEQKYHAAQRALDSKVKMNEKTLEVAGKLKELKKEFEWPHWHCESW